MNGDTIASTDEVLVFIALRASRLSQVQGRPVNRSKEEKPTETRYR